MATNTQEYDFSKIEPHWQSFWGKNKTFKAIDFDSRPRYYVLDMFPYPSGAGLHIGHPEGYTASDILGRYKKACGYNVLHPMGWDAFGLPAEQHAITTGTHPAINTQTNIDRFREQIKSLGFAIDWDREINTTDPEYYRWTQWIFLQLFKHGLAYVDERPVWWCPALGTVLANEEVIEGRSERGNHPVERRNLRQWVLRITAYADKLQEALETIDWPDSTKRQQIAWIGRSEGAEIHFSLENDASEYLTVFTTRPDTLFGVSFMAIAPEHPLLNKIVSQDHKAEIDAYIQQAKSKSDLERTDLAKNKTGVFTGGYVLHPFTNVKIPVWVADYVLMSYGTGAIMGVPAHDERDHEFALKYHLTITPVIEDLLNKDAQYPYSSLSDNSKVAKIINSGEFNNLSPKAALKAITEALQKRNQGKPSVNYKLRDWLFSRQRYWGEPFPITWVDEKAYQKLKELKNSPLYEFLPKEPVTYKQDSENWYAIPMLSKQLPLILPEVQNYLPSETGESPLVHAKDWLNVWLNLDSGEVIEGRMNDSSAPNQTGTWVKGMRETNTMPQWAGSCWYYLRYLDPHNSQQLADPKLLEYWGMPDFYIGGAEHAVLHLLYARFWHKFLYDIGILKTPEPFKRLFHQGLILGEDGHKMSKSRGNTVNPDDIVKEYGADALRCFEMFLGPLEDMKPWNTNGIEGLSRFLKKVWREYITGDGKLNPKIIQSSEENQETLALLHQTIKKVTEDIEALSFNTAISQMMIFINHLQKAEKFSFETATVFLQLLAPFAPHMAEELWERLGHQPSITEKAWPKYDPANLVQNEVNIALLVNGKVRAEVCVSKDAEQEYVLSLAKSHERMKPFLDGKQIIREIYVPGKILNIVVK